MVSVQRIEKENEEYRKNQCLKGAIDELRLVAKSAIVCCISREKEEKEEKGFSYT